MSARLTAGALVSLVVGCGGGFPDTSPRTAPGVAPDPTTHAEAPPAEEPDRVIHSLNAQARAGAVTETLHGLEIADPYRALEEDTPATQAWIDAQTARTTEWLAAHARPETEARLAQLLAIGTLGGIDAGGERLVYTKREPGREQPALYLVQGATRSAEPLVDPTTYGERAALDWYALSPRGKYIAFGISTNGDERSTLHVLDVDTRTVLPDTIPNTKWSNVAWLNDERGFYYTRYPRPGEDAYDAAHEDTYFPRVFFHALGADQAADVRVFSGAQPTDFPAPSVSDDDRYLVVNNFRGWSESDVFVLDRRPRRGPPAATPTPVVEGRAHLTTGRIHRGKLYLLTNEGAPKYTLVRADDPMRGGDATARRVVLAESESPIDSWTVCGDRLAVQYVDDVRARLRFFDLDGHETGEAQLPTRGSLTGLAADPAHPRIALTFSSYFYPPTLFSADAHTGALTELDRVQTDFDVSRYELSQERVASRDGTLINVYFVHARGVQRDGNNPVLLTAYGGFNVSLMPEFSRTALYWLERGGIYAVANLRGGAEFGEAWHRAGNLDNKVHVFEDFEAVVRWFSSSGLSRPERIALTGGSNGGLLMGAAITRFPDAFRATTAYVGLYDMVRYQRFPPAELWVSEYGDAADPAALRTLLSYSPYHQVRDGVAYPWVYIETADHDSRVYWGHSTKFAARLEEATSAADHPVLFYRERDVGHGAGTRLSDLVRKYSRGYAFVETALGMR